jgi:hypothetical protein
MIGISGLKAGGDTWGVARWLRHGPQPERMAEALRTLGTMPWYGGRLLVSHAGGAFDRAGRLANDTTKDQLRQFIEGFVAFVRRVPGLER